VDVGILTASREERLIAEIVDCTVDRFGKGH